MGRRKRKTPSPDAGRTNVRGPQPAAKASPEKTAAGTGDTPPRGQDSLVCTIEELTEPHNPTWLAGIVALFVALPAIVAPYGTESGYSPDLHMSAYLQVLGCLLAVVLFVQRVSTRNNALIFDELFILLSLVVTWALISLSWAHNLYEATVKLFDWLAALVGAFLVVQVIRTPRHLRFFMEALFWSGVVLALLGIAQYLYRVQWIAQQVPPAATFANKNMAAHYYLLTFPLGVALYWRNDKRLLHWVYAFGTALIVLALLYTRTRSASLSFLVALGVLCGFCVYEIRQSRNPFANKRGNVAIAAAVVFMLIALHFNAKGFNWFWDKVVAGGASTVQEVQFDGTGNTRISIWANTLAMIGDHPVLGVGMGNWSVEYPFYHTRVFVDREMGYAKQHINAHNDYLEIVAELGLFGLLGLVWLSVAVFSKCLALFADANNEHRTVRACLLAALAGMACTALFSFPLQQPVSVFLIFIYICLFSSLGRSHPPRAAWWRIRGFGLRLNRNAIGYGLSAFFAVWFVVLLAVHVRLYQSELYFRRATIELNQEAYAPMLTAGLRAHQLNPYRDHLLDFVAAGYYKRGEYQRAIESFERILKAYPYVLDVLLNASVSYIRAGYPEKALEKLQMLESIRPHDHKVATRMASLLDRMERKEEALGYLEKAIALAPEGEERARLQARYDKKSRAR